MRTADDRMRVAALAYAGMRLPVFPLHGVFAGRCECGRTCSNAGKHPLVRGWQNTIPSLSAADRAWPHNTRRGIGLVTGPASGLFAVDVDPRHGGRASLDQLQEHFDALPPSWETRTGSGGTHLLFAWPGHVEIRNSAGHIGAGLDVRGKGGYIVLPPSRHPGGEYSWVNAPEAVELAHAPTWLIKLATARKRRARPLAQGMAVRVGERHGALISLLGLMRSWGANEATLRGAAEAFVQTQCEVDPKTPIDYEHVLATVHSVATSWDPDPYAPRSITHYQRDA